MESYLRLKQAGQSVHEPINLLRNISATLRKQEDIIQSYDQHIGMNCEAFRLPSQFTKKFDTFLQKEKRRKQFKEAINRFFHKFT